MRWTLPVCLLATAALAPALTQDDDYARDLEKWRADRETRLKAPRGWLSVGGLYWLQPGENTVGSGSDNALRFPSSAPANLGTFTLKDKKVSLFVAAGVQATVDGKPFQGGVLRSDAEENTDEVKLGDLLFHVIQRGERIGVRLYDPANKKRQEFRRLDWYPLDKSLVVEAKFVPYDPPKMLPILNVIGDTRMAQFPGYAVFTLDGKEHRLEAEDAGGALFFNFQDKTSGKTTYGAGRYLDADAPKDGKVILDFNRAVSPPCAYTDFATCPLPPKGNTLAIEIRAGEKYKNH